VSRGALFSPPPAAAAAAAAADELRRGLQALRDASNYGALAEDPLYTKKLMGKHLAALEELFQQLQAAL
jgi:hypothetical protein